MRSIWWGKTNLKLWLVTWYFVYFFKRFTSFNGENFRSVGWSVSKLPAVKFWGLKKKSAGWPWPFSNQLARIRVCLGSESKFLDEGSSFEPEFILRLSAIISNHQIWWHLAEACCAVLLKESWFNWGFWTFDWSVWNIFKFYSKNRS